MLNVVFEVVPLDNQREEMGSGTIKLIKLLPKVGISPTKFHCSEISQAADFGLFC
jgi:hypothetical protein